ncbi:MAG TPA: fumarylacetoacetate hydrolase family protein [Pirellulales bacterium]|jgi:2-keto-4-pentenoate hydratase/2-oxohepta-3-ene-1,7-dioic acid hydratase in catechol pathway|nr:fumarylacetoacetate hydrolase family protein [Pirellulales bacterium]
MRTCILGFVALLVAGSSLGAAEPTRYVRFRAGDTTAYGIVEGKLVRQLDGNLFRDPQKTDKTFPLADVKLLVPTRPRQVLAMAANYRSHLKGEEIPEKFKIPQPFVKGTACLVPHEAKIVLPKDSGPVHYEAELVVVIGKKARKVSKSEAADYVFGVTCGNDVSERYWQNDEEHKDVQWWRAKGSDTFGPCGPWIVSGLDYGNLAVRLRLNGETRQEDRTSALIHDVPTMVSFISQYMTLYPGDLIFTGTPGKTDALKAGDTVEVEIDGIGTLRNTVVKAK